MFNRSFCLSFLLTSLYVFSQAELSAAIVETDHFDVVLEEVDENTLFLVDIDDTLIDSPYSLGSRHWREHIRTALAEFPAEVDIHDLLTALVAKKLPFVSPEEQIPEIIRNLQENEVPVLGFTARGTDLWYSTQIAGIDKLTVWQVENIGVSFDLSLMPPKLQDLDPAHYSRGIFFTSPEKKGTFLKKLLLAKGYVPAKIVAIDDKRAQLESLEKEMQSLGINFTGYVYTRCDSRHEDFNPFASAIQLEHLLLGQGTLSEAEAAAIAQTLEAEGIEGDAYLVRLLERHALSELLQALQHEILEIDNQ